MRDMNGNKLVPGVNADKINVQAGLAELRVCGYDHPNTFMLIEYCLNRWAKGEEELAQKTAMATDLNGINYTSWLRVLAAARANA